MVRVLLFVIHHGLTAFLVLVNYLRVHVKPMYQLYCILKDWDVPPTLDEIAIASGKKWLDRKTEVEYFKKLERASENIKKAFEEQQARATVSENHTLDYLRLMIWCIQ